MSMGIGELRTERNAQASRAVEADARCRELLLQQAESEAKRLSLQEACAVEQVELKRVQYQWTCA